MYQKAFNHLPLWSLNKKKSKFKRIQSLNDHDLNSLVIIRYLEKKSIVRIMFYAYFLLCEDVFY